MSGARPGVAVLVSGRGRNLQAIIDAVASGDLPVDLRAVLSNRPDAAALRRAESAGIPARALDPADYPDRRTFDLVMADRIDEYAPDILALAGYMRILDSAFVQRFSGRLINIHPSLLPRHRGLHTHRRALEAGDDRHGATVHYVTDDLDAGPALLQGSVAVANNDTPDRLAQRVMDRVETRIYPQALGWLAAGRTRFNDGRVQLDGATLETPVHVDCDSE